MNPKDIKNALSTVFKKHEDRVVFAYLFGSAVSGNMTTLSDIDIAVFLKKQKPDDSFFDMKLSLYADFCRVLKRNDVDVVVLNTTINIMLLDEIIRYGTVLTDRNSNIRNEFECKVLHQFIDFKEQRIAVLGI
ncbi:MAG: nucleotidyltransferase domain-containing protein [Candidatus Kuenenia sp.]|nr:nucleotidyltransferase domain-containing protein [Candidatus Kuenenia hertensis]